MPGTLLKTARSSSTSSGWVTARVHSRRGRSAMKKSDSSIPIGSVATSAVPSRVQTCSISSGNPSSSARSRRSLRTTASSTDTPARRTVLTASACSPSFGRNSPPSRVARQAPPARISAATVSVRSGWRNAADSSGA